MKILIDLQCCQSESRFGGIGRYSMSLAKAMIRLGSGHHFGLLLNASLPNENLIRAEFSDLLQQQDIHTFSVPPYIAADNELPAHTRVAELIREKHIAEIGPDVLHIASLFEGAGENVVSSVGMLFPAERTAVTLYDLIPFLEQETYLGNPVLADHYLRKFEQLQTAGALVSISEFSRQEALEHTRVPSGRIVNISSAVDRQFGPRLMPEADKSQLLRKLGIDKPFAMFTGSFDARKNHVRLLKAFAKARPTLAQPCQLVIVGKGDARVISRLRTIARYHGLADEDLVFVGHATDADLIALYNLATLFVFPSLREGFGLPVLEAMSCGVPTIGSNRTSVPEVIGRADALFDPCSVDDIAAKISLMLTDSPLRDELRRHGLEQAKNFSWELSARRALDVFERMGAVAAAAATTSVYDDFCAVMASLDLGIVGDEFLPSAARVIAANELLARPGADGVHRRVKTAWVTSWTAGSDLAADSQPFDVVVIQAGQGTFGLHQLADLVVQQAALGRHVFVTFHSTQDFDRLTAVELLGIRAAFKGCTGIFVHTMKDVATLENLGIRRNVGFVPRPDPAQPGQPDAVAQYMERKMEYALSTAATPGRRSLSQVLGPASECATMSGCFIEAS